MITPKYSIELDAAPASVWEALWTDEHFRHWTAAFCEGSHAVGEWKKGGKIHFLDGQGRGMCSSISQLETNHLMEFNHHVDIENVAEQPSGAFEGYKESYRLETTDNGVRLLIEADTMEEY